MNDAPTTRRFRASRFAAYVAMGLGLLAAAVMLVRLGAVSMAMALFVLLFLFGLNRLALRGWRLKLVLAGPAFTLLIAGLFLCFLAEQAFPSRAFPPLLQLALPAAAASSLGLCAAAWPLLKSRASGGKARRAALGLFLTLLASLGLAAWGGVRVFNAGLDRSASDILREAPVLAKKSVCARGECERFLLCRPWSGSEAEARLPVDQPSYDHAEPGDLLRLRLRPGRLGFEWAAGWELAG